jgi:cytochrome c biogenesis protein ResB
MGLEFRLLRYFEHAEESFDFKTMERASDLTTAAIQIAFQDKTYWLQLNDVLKIFTKGAVYIVTYGSRRIDLGFNLQLQRFEIGRDPGTNKAASYQSLVQTPDGKETLIAMNEPLKYQGLTFYQASFQEGPDGVPVASILSVNHDPGRWLKYLGSLILTLGVVWLFYNKRKAARAQAPSKEVV